MIEDVFLRLVLIYKLCELSLILSLKIIHPLIALHFFCVNRQIDLGPFTLYSLFSFGDEGAQAISEALKVNNTLKILALNYNQIGDEGAEALADALKANKTLEKLELNDNQIQYKGAEYLADALKVNIKLAHLLLERNQSFFKADEALADALKVNKTLLVLEYDYLQMPSSIRNELEINKKIYHFQKKLTDNEELLDAAKLLLPAFSTLPKDVLMSIFRI